MTESLNIHQRINAVRKKVGYIKKDSRVQGQYSAVTHDNVIAHVRGALIEHGVLVVPTETSSQTIDAGVTSKGATIIRYAAWYQIDLINCDAPEDKISVAIEAHANDQGDKAPGKALSYAVKSVLLKVFALETGEDDESRVHTVARINEQQQQQIAKLLDETGSNVSGFLVTVGNRISSSPYESIADIPAVDYNTVVKIIQDNAKRRARQQAKKEKKQSETQQTNDFTPLD